MCGVFAKLHTTMYHYEEEYVVYFQRIFFYKCIKVTFNLVWITVSLCMAVARRKILTWFKGYKIMQQDWNFDYINSRGIDLVKSLNLYTIRERRDYFLLTLMFKAIHGIAPNYFSDRIDMHFDIHGYNTREAGSINVYLPTVHKEMYKNSFFIFGRQTLEWSARFCEKIYEYRHF